jgi:hypothetical protein
MYVRAIPAMAPLIRPLQLRATDSSDHVLIPDNIAGDGIHHLATEPVAGVPVDSVEPDLLAVGGAQPWPLQIGNIAIAMSMP